ncbi:MAG TPA: GNAT family N-acetyltransferase [Pirellulales bacterium]
MIRPVKPDDKPGLLAVAEASGLFAAPDLDFLSGMLDEHFAGKGGEDHFWITDDENGPVGVAYYAPAPLTDRTWSLYLIAVHPDRQGRGRGAALVRFIEESLAARGERLLIVETSGVTSFERTRAFYRKCGYDEEGRIRDYYREGDDKIVFRKSLAAVAK